MYECIELEQRIEIKINTVVTPTHAYIGVVCVRVHAYVLVLNEKNEIHTHINSEKEIQSQFNIGSICSHTTRNKSQSWK